jgi:hypothetical protein
MYCIARQRVLPTLSKEQAENLLTEAALHSLTEVFEAVPDPRGVHGLRYDLPFLLTCLVAALLCNCDGSEAVAQWCRDHLARLALRVLQRWRGCTLTLVTIASFSPGHLVHVFRRGPAASICTKKQESQGGAATSPNSIQQMRGRRRSMHMSMLGFHAALVTAAGQRSPAHPRYD